MFTLPIILLIIGLISFIISIHLTVKTDEPFFIPGTLLVSLSILPCILEPNDNYTTYELTTIQQIVETPREALAVTPYKTFTTKSLEEVNDWKNNSPKYIKQEYNHFGFKLDGETLVSKDLEEL
jgi:putative effector of murein hydrolase